MNTLLQVQGRVEWWLYTVSHGQLLLRRPKGLLWPHRLDILFKDVAEVRVVSFFDNLRVMELRKEDSGVDTMTSVGRRSLYGLWGENAVGYVIAGAIAWSEDDGDYNEPSSLIQ